MNGTGNVPTTWTAVGHIDFGSIKSCRSPKPVAVVVKRGRIARLDFSFDSTTGGKFVVDYQVRRLLGGNATEREAWLDHGGNANQ